MGAILVFDITNHETYENLNRWNQELLKYLGPKIQIMLVGNKTDKKHLRSVTTEEARQYAENHQFSYMETSAKEGTNVNELFEELLKLETSRVLSLQPIEDNDKKKGKKKGKCSLM